MTQAKLPGDLPALVLGTGLGAGYSPFAPGTAGSLFPGLVLAWALGLWHPWAGLAAAFPLFAVGCWAAGRCERMFGRRDPGRCVIDEVLGILVSTAGFSPRWQVLAGGFILFRIFDIWKPWPVRWADRRVQGGFGIMLDDLLAAVYARGALEIILRLI